MLKKPEGYGKYFAWGETTWKTTYSWSTYTKYREASTLLTKYVTTTACGNPVDNKKTLELSDDVARANWGGTWRMPTSTEIEELNSKCSWTKTTQNGVNGYLVTGPNGNSIFLPCAGHVSGDQRYGAGTCGHYWSSSLSNTQVNFYARYLDFDNSGRYTNYHVGRCAGLSVRPVTE